MVSSLLKNLCAIYGNSLHDAQRVGEPRNVRVFESGLRKLRNFEEMLKVRERSRNLSEILKQ